MLTFTVLAALVAVCHARPGQLTDSYAAPISGSNPSGPVYGAPAQAPVVHKHVYVHVPPPEPQGYAPRRPAPPPPPAQKHYKIVFIKAPTPPTPTAPVIPSIPQDEQKTLIYVLVKKPEEQPEINIPAVVPTPPSKPEVYFIRYKTQKQEGGYPDSGVPNNAYGAPPSGPAPAPPSDTYGGPAPAPVPSNSYGAPSGSSY